MALKILDENEHEDLWLRFGAGFSPSSNGVILEYEDKKYIIDIYSGLTFWGDSDEVRDAPKVEIVQHEDYVLPMFTLTTR